MTDEKLQDLIDKMQYKSENIKARFEPSVFIDVVDALKELKEYRQRELACKVFTIKDVTQEEINAFKKYISESEIQPM